jgi:methionyl-tRNA formyltransferase
MKNASKSLKFIFFGTPDVAKETLERLVAAGLCPDVVVTNPDAPKGRGHVLTPSPVKSYAESLGLPVLTPPHLDDELIKEISVQGFDLAIVVAYGKILPESLINSFPKGVLNIHYSLLPRWRGASPVESALLNGDEKTGVSIQQMVKKLDAGNVIAVKEVDIAPEDTTASLRPRLITLGADLLIETLPKYLNGEVTPVPQDESQVTAAPKFKKEDGLINPNGDDLLNWRKYRAFAVWPGTYFFKDEKRYKITSAVYHDGKFITKRVIPEGGKEIDYQ